MSKHHNREGYFKARIHKWDKHGKLAIIEEYLSSVDACIEYARGFKSHMVKIYNNGELIHTENISYDTYA